MEHGGPSTAGRAHGPRERQAVATRALPRWNLAPVCVCVLFLKTHRRGSRCSRRVALLSSEPPVPREERRLATLPSPRAAHHRWVRACACVRVRAFLSQQLFSRDRARLLPAAAAATAARAVRSVRLGAGLPWRRGCQGERVPDRAMADDRRRAQPGPP